ncbi:hypothetical protein COMA1_10350 [Candidatus Nitrospira nitrosa]|uniref:Uncharacterized protein n=1 Tax=Candidatus Nitrospira nitrosa TaxID=1742972 RepID=A0A0S4L7V6_9BACT|nr:hypothetical protein COMA1_10350 [Candidatus Nitrospira nitrosa]
MVLLTYTHSSVCIILHWRWHVTAQAYCWSVTCLTEQALSGLSRVRRG